MVLRKRNDKGMTLVEVIIAITILALVAIPVLHSMTSAIYYNAKARTRQSLTLSAESLMETFKGYDLGSLREMFEQASVGDSFAMKELGVTEADGFEYPSDLSASELTFRVNGMRADDGNTTCDIEIKASKQAESVTTVMEMENILPTRDAIFRADIQYDTRAAADAQADFQANYQADFLNELNALDDREWELTQSDIDLSCLTLYQRELVFTISGSGSSDVVTAYMEYTYYIKEHKYYENPNLSEESEESQEEQAETQEQIQTQPEEVILTECTLTYPANVENYFKIRIPLSPYTPAAVSGEYTIYTNPIQDGEHPLQRLLLYYYPAYNLEKADSILIKNPDARSLDCYLIKQKSPSLSYAQLQTKETNYQPSVRCEGAGNVALFHNLNTNLADQSTVLGATSGVTAFSTVESYVGAHLKKEKVLVYDLEMKVYSNGAEIASFEGTMNEYMDN